MEDRGISPPGMPITREGDEGRGTLGRLGNMQEAREKFDKASAEGQKKDGEAIHDATENGVKKVQQWVEKVGAGVEKVVKIGDRIYRGAEAGVKRVATDSWQAVVGFAEDTRDVVYNSGRAALGVTVAALAIPTAAVVVGVEHAAVGLVEMGQRGALGVRGLRTETHNLFNRGVQALAAAVEARNLISQDNRETARAQHQDRLAKIQSAYIGRRVVNAGKQAVDRFVNG